MYLLLSLLMFIDPVGPKVITPVKGVTRSHWTPGDWIFASVLVVLAIVVAVALLYVLVSKLRGGRMEPLLRSPIAVEPVSLTSPRRQSYRTPMDDIIESDNARADQLDRLEAEKRRWAARNGFRAGAEDPQTKG